MDLNMKIIKTGSIVEDVPKGAVLSIGNFDGVHLGHRQILTTARRLADAKGARLAVMTFDPHPAAILHPERAPGMLTSADCKAQLLEAAGVDVLIVVTDSLQLLNMSPTEFVDQFLMKHMAPCAVVEGPNFTFGYGRSGTVETLRELGDRKGFEVMEVPFTKISLPDERREMTCSSSAVRRFLEGGQVAQAAKVLGRNYRLLGTSIPGRGIGRALGFPTANLMPEPQVIPAEGVYAGYVVIAEDPESLCQGGRKRPAAFSIGRAKTFITDHPLLLEAHLLETNVEPLYGKRMAMEFVEMIRCQQRFESPEALKEQIAKDCQQALSILQNQ